MNDDLYLDHNATTPLLPEVAEAMAACQRDAFGNPSSQHRAGRAARRMLEDAREGVAEILGVDLHAAPGDSLVFSSGGTEANNLAVFGLAGERPCRLGVSAIEHPSVSEPAKRLAQRGCEVVMLPVSSSGVLQRPALDALLARRPRFLSVILANNETGVLQPIAELADACREADVALHTDAVQAAGKIPLSFRELGVTAMTVAAHKFHGPRGVGALAVRHGATLRPLLFGGHQQSGLRPGVEPVVPAVGMHAALRAWQAEQAVRQARLAQLRDQLQAALLHGWPDLIVHSADAPRLPNTLCVAFPGLNRQALVMALDMAGVAVSTGSACASGSTDPSPTLVAMRCSQAVLASSIRLSLGATTTAAEVDLAARRILRVCSDLRAEPSAGFLAGTARS